MLCSLHSPLRQIFRRFDDLDRHLVIMLECLTRIGLEGLHLFGTIDRYGGRMSFEVEPASVDDAEESSPEREPMSTEHGAASQSMEISQLIQDEILVFIRLSHQGVRAACGLRPFERQAER